MPLRTLNTPSGGGIFCGIVFLLIASFFYRDQNAIPETVNKMYRILNFSTYYRMSCGVFGSLFFITSFAWFLNKKYPLLSYFGKISLGIYVVHVTMLCLIKYYIGVIPCFAHRLVFLPLLLAVIAFTYFSIRIIQINKRTSRLLLGA